jgi:site-specific recombinase XerD
MFPNSRGGVIDQKGFIGLLVKVQVAAALALDTGRKDRKGRTIWAPRYDWHHLRHVAASNWLNDGIDLKRLQVWIGHENIQLTIDVYGHLMIDAKKEAALAAGAEAALLG